MASPSLPPSSTASPSYRPSVDSILQALDRLKGYGLGQDDIVALLKLGPAGVGKILYMLEREGRPGVDMLLGSLEGVSEATLGRLIGPQDAVAHETSERGRLPSIVNPPPSPIDNNVYASTATPPALATSRSTPYLRLPPSSLQHSTSTRSVRSVSSKGSSSTNITHPSSPFRVEKPKRVPSKTARKQLYCPECEKNIKNGFHKHFCEHLNYLIGSPEVEIDAHDAIGCGYCHAQGVLVTEGKVFHGAVDFVQHIKDAHASTLGRLHWDISHSINHILSAQRHFRRKILDMIDRDRQKSGNQHNTMPPSLSWVPDDRHLLKELQILSGRIDSGQLSHEDGYIDILLTQVYDAAAQKWQQPFAYSFPPMPQHVIPRKPLQQSIPYHPPQRSLQDMSIVGVGGKFDTPTPKRCSFESDMRSPTVFSPSPQVAQVPPHIQSTQQHSQMKTMGDDAPPQRAGSSTADMLPPPPMIAFDGHPSYSTPLPSHGLQFGSMQDIYDDFDIGEQDIFRG